MSWGSGGYAVWSTGQAMCHLMLQMPQDCTILCKNKSASSVDSAA